MPLAASEATHGPGWRGACEWRPEGTGTVARTTLVTARSGAHLQQMTADRGAAERLVYLDNLKWVLIAGVIAGHAAMAYGAIGTSFYTEPTLGPLANAVTSVLIAVGLLFLLGTFMLVAGLLTAPALGRKGTGRFVRDRPPSRSALRSPG